jgi:hypothetical protein
LKFLKKDNHTKIKKDRMKYNRRPFSELSMSNFNSSMSKVPEFKTALQSIFDGQAVENNAIFGGRVSVRRK